MWSAIRADDARFLELEPSMVSWRLPCFQMKATSVGIHLQWDIRNSLSQMSIEPQLFFVYKVANWGGRWGGKAIFRVAVATPSH